MDTPETRQLPANGTAPAPERHRLTDEGPVSDLTDEALPAVPDLKNEEEQLEPIQRALPPFKLMATIKKSSKYYHQGLIDPYNSKSKPRAFPVTSIHMMDADSYDFRFNGNAYRREDLQLWVEVAGKLKKI